MKTANEKKQSNPRVKEWFESGDADLTAKRLGMAFLCISVGLAYHEEADEICKRHGLVYHDLKFLTGKLQRAFDQYNRQMMGMLDREGGDLLCGDYDKFKSMCDEYMNN